MRGADQPEETNEPTPRDRLETPEWVGPYRILEKIGDGGMGAVFVGEQREPVHRRVAVKVVKPGLETAEVLARFEAERQALALMEHPNIARVFDAGIDALQRPYFAMEFVRGEELTDFCDRHELEVRERLELFIAVCAGVSHAHQKGVIHRDLKPANVLVTRVDGRPVPKIIDFGIAKATDQRLSPHTVYTQIGAILGTIEYMSPEQAGNSLDVDTRSDVYSLGVILYELLAGHVPMGHAELLVDGPLAMQKMLRERTPPRPSTRVSTDKRTATEVARRRKLDERTLVRRLRGELDWITMRALEKERDRRYQTVQELADDVRRYLDNKAIAAGPPSLRYRARKTISRHRGAFASAALVLLALCVGLWLAISAWGEARRQEELARTSELTALEDRRLAIAARESAEAARVVAAEERLKAEVEARRANQVVGLLDEMIGFADPHRTRSPEYTMRDLLEHFEADLGDRLEGQPQVEATLRRTMGRAFLGLGMNDAAAPHLERALHLQQQLNGPDATGTLRAQLDVADLHHGRGDYEAAAAVTARALTSLEAMPEDADVRDGLVEGALVKLADYDKHLGRARAAEAWARRALAQTLRIRADDRRAIGRRKSELGFLRELQEDYAGAEALYREAAELMDAASGADDPQTIFVRGRLGNVLVRRGAAREALPMLEAYLDEQLASFGEESGEVIPPMIGLGYAYTYADEHERAESLLRRACELVDLHGGERNLNFAPARCQLGICLQAQSKWPEAIARLDEARTFLVARYGDGHPEVATVTMNVAETHCYAGQFDAAVSEFERAAAAYESLQHAPNLVRCLTGLFAAHANIDLTRLPRVLQECSPRIAAVVSAPEALVEIQRFADGAISGATQLGKQQPERAVAMLRTLAAIVTPLSEQTWTAVPDYNLGKGLLIIDELDEARTVLERGYAKVADVEERRVIAQRIARALANCYERLQRPDEAARWQARSEK